MTDRDDQASPAEDDGPSHVEQVLLADLRGLVEYARTTSDPLLVDQVCVTVAAFRAASIEQCLTAIVEQLGFGQVETEAAIAASKGQIQ